MSPKSAIAKAMVGGLLAILLVGCGSRSEETKAGKAPKAPVRHEAPGSAQDSRSDDALADVFFISRATLPPGAKLPPGPAPKVGFAVGTGNTILKTSDGGVTWRRVVEQKKDGADFDCVRFTSPSDGWVVDKSLLLHTRDAGESWQPMPKPAGTFYYFGPCAVSATSYFQIQPPTYGVAVWRTTDGAAWAALKAPLPRNDYECIHFFDDLHGWLAGNYGHFTMTEDGGQTWREANLPDRGHFVQIQFVTPRLGWMRPYLDGIGAMRFTADGGRTWQKRASKEDVKGTVADMQFLDERVGFLLIHVETGKSSVLRTLDGGKTWETLGVHHTDLAALCFVDPNEGWVVGEGGCIFHYGK